MHVLGETKVLLFILVICAATTFAADPYLTGKDAGKCGPNNLLPDGRPGECRPKGKHPCCNPTTGWCGSSSTHCTCADCTDYRKITTTPQPTQPPITKEATTESSKLPPYDIHDKTYNREGRNVSIDKLPFPAHNQVVTQRDEPTTQSTSTTTTGPRTYERPTPAQEVSSDDPTTTPETTTLAKDGTDETTPPSNNTDSIAFDGPGFRSLNGSKGGPVPTNSDEIPEPSVGTTVEAQTEETLPTSSHEVTQDTEVTDDTGNAGPKAKVTDSPPVDEGSDSWIGLVIALCVILLIAIACIILVIRNKRRAASQNIMDPEDGAVNGAFQAKEQETTLSYSNKGTLPSEEKNPKVTVTPSSPDTKASTDPFGSDTNAESNKQQEEALTMEDTKEGQAEADKDTLLEKDNTNDELNAEEKGKSNDAFKEDNAVKIEG